MRIAGTWTHENKPFDRSASESACTQLINSGSQSDVFRIKRALMEPHKGCIQKKPFVLFAIEVLKLSASRFSQLYLMGFLNTDPGQLQHWLCLFLISNAVMSLSLGQDHLN